MRDVLPLFRYAETRPVVAPSASEQSRELARVAKGIALHVLEFCRQHPAFHADELRAYVAAKTGGAPGSPDRILRQLRGQGFVNYTVERSASRYTITGVR